MDHFLYKLLPPRPTFPQDMNAAEGAAMRDHVVYWQSLIARRSAIVFGLVHDPSGPWGLAVVRAGSREDVETIGAQDPAVTRANATFEVCAMPGAIAA
jgi:hypothetical protein